MTDETVQAAVVSAVTEDAKVKLAAVGDSLEAKAQSFVSAHKLGLLLLTGIALVVGFLLGKLF